MAFDVDAALKAGYSKQELVEYLASENKFDVAGARKAGYTNDDILPILTGGAASQIPGPTPGQVAPPATNPVAPASNRPVSAGDRVIGAGEAALSMATGLTGGAIGMIGGTAKGVLDSVMRGDFGSEKSSNATEQQAVAGAQALTYAPRTQSGQEQAEALGQVLQSTVPVMPLTAELGMMGRGIAPAATAARDAARSALPAAKQIAAQAADAVRSKAAPAGPMAAEQIASVTKKAVDGGRGGRKATEALAAEAAPNNKTVEAAERLGISDYLQPDHVTTSQSYRELFQAVKSIPGSAAREAELAGYEAIGARAERLIQEIGGETDLSLVDSRVKSTMTATQQALEQTAGNLYQQVRDSVPAVAEAPATNVLSFIAKRAEELGGEKNLSAAEKRLVNKLTPQDGIEPTYALMDDQRKVVGAALSRSGPFKDMDSGLAKSLYEKLTQDQEAVVGRYGASETYEAAKASIRTRKGLEDDLVSLYGRALDGSITGELTGAVRSASSGDVSRIVGLIKATPENLRQEVMASGVATAFRTASTRGPINFTTYAKWYEGLLRNKRAYAAVMSNLPPAARKSLSDLYRVSEGISAASRERITTGRIQAISDQFTVADGLASRIYQFSKRNVIAAGAGTAVGAAAGAVAGPVMGSAIGSAVTAALVRGAKPHALKAADALITSPEFLKLVKASQKRGISQESVTDFAHSQAFARYARAAKLEPGLAARRKWVLDALRSAAANQQTEKNGTN